MGGWEEQRIDLGENKPRISIRYSKQVSSYVCLLLAAHCAIKNSFLSVGIIKPSAIKIIEIYPGYIGSSYKWEISVRSSAVFAFTFVAEDATQELQCFFVAKSYVLKHEARLSKKQLLCHPESLP
jgi:hypothetical protein